MEKKDIKPDATAPAISSDHILRMDKKIASLIIVQGRELGREFRLKRSLNIIGRDESAHITIIGDPKVSRRHASVRAEYDLKNQRKQYIISDLGSTNNTYVNGEQISKKTLSAGDKITIGDTFLNFMIQDEIDASFHEEIQRRLNYDQLTGLLTRDSFELAVRTELDKCRKQPVSIALMMLDFDRFKKINDTYGHMAGSFVLSKIGDLFKKQLHTKDLIGRYGGEEFMIFLPDISQEKAIKIAQHIRKSLKKHSFPYQKEKIKLTISIGISFYPDHGRTIEDLIHCADIALYDAKRAGRDQVSSFNPQLKTNKSPMI